MSRYEIRIGVTKETARGIWPDVEPENAPESWSFSPECKTDAEAVRAMAQAVCIHGAPWALLYAHTPAARRHALGRYLVASWTPRNEIQPRMEPKPWFATFGARKPVEVSR